MRLRLKLQRLLKADECKQSFIKKNFHKAPSDAKTGILQHGFLSVLSVCGDAARLEGGIRDENHGKRQDEMVRFPLALRDWVKETDVKISE